jgi:hypothetical protein
MLRKAVVAAAAAGALALGVGAFATPADAYVRFGVYAGPGYYGGPYCGPWWNRHPCHRAYYYGAPYHSWWWYHHHPYYRHY